MTVEIVLGTRPEIIKMSPVIRELQDRGIDFEIIHTGQHYSYELDQVFFDQLGLPEPKHTLEVGSGTHGQQTGRMLEKIERILLEREPRAVFYQGDTNSVVSAALASVKIESEGYHIEAGLRSYDRDMPEEHNRVVADHVSDYLFAPTSEAKKNLLDENIPESRIHVTGNTIVDAVLQNRKMAERSSEILERHNLDKRDYILLTLHRAENVDEKERLAEIIEGLEKISEEIDSDIIYPVHPRTEKRLEEFSLQDRLKSIRGMTLVGSLPFLDFLKLESNATLVLTDSGGVQEEACILQVPCVTLRDNTERPETVEVGANKVATVDSDKIMSAARQMLNLNRGWENPFGDGDASQKVVDVLEEIE